MSVADPRVTVVLPAHNRASTLPRAIRSVLDQTYADLELIVVDDGSTDATADVLGRITDPRLRCLRLMPRRGAAAARNAGIAVARGELVAFQDSDDEWLPRKLELQLALLAASPHELGGVGGRYRIDVPGATGEVVAPALETGGDYERELLEGPCLITPLWMIRRSLLEELGGFDERMPCLEDWDLMLRLSRRSRLSAVDEPVLIKHGAPDTLGADPDRRGPAMQALLERHGTRFLAVPERHGRFCLELAELCFRRGQAPHAVRYALRSLRRRGASPSAVLALFGRALAARVRERLSEPRPAPAPGSAE